MIRNELREGFPVRCYKYRASKAALKSLESGELYFALPSELNDSLEGSFENAPIRSFAETLSETFNELARARGHVGGKFKMPEEFESYVITSHQKEGEGFKNYSARLGIFSAAARPDNQPMWAYYCENACGVCFNLEWSPEIANKYSLIRRDVIYAGESRIHNRGEDFRYFMLQVAKENPSWSPEQVFSHVFSRDFMLNIIIRAATRAVSIKHPDWAHENEIRLVAAHGGALPLLRDVLNEVIFVRTDFKECRSIIRLLNEQYPKVKLKRLMFNHKEPFTQIEDFKG